MIFESKSQNIVINVSHCMVNATGHYLNEDIIRAVTYQSPELVPFTKTLNKWVSEDELVALVNILDEKSDQENRFKSSRVNNSIKRETRKVYACINKHFKAIDLIELGYSEDLPVNEVVTQKELIKDLKERAASWSTNLDSKNLLHAAAYKIALLKETHFNLANSIGMDQ
jgi:hypothetical protein